MYKCDEEEEWNGGGIGEGWIVEGGMDLQMLEMDG